MVHVAQDRVSQVQDDHVPTTENGAVETVVNESDVVRPLDICRHGLSITQYRRRSSPGLYLINTNGAPQPELSRSVPCNNMTPTQTAQLKPDLTNSVPYGRLAFVKMVSNAGIPYFEFTPTISTSIAEVA